ncbi:MAG: hypothetical protein QNJ40_00115 [Xanthomonadales bacterium]|nr:hypothetical protein [Xanthomonadales bacterium]
MQPETLVELHLEGDLVVARVKDGAERPDNYEYSQTIMDFCHNNECSRVLLDERQGTWGRNFFEDYKMLDLLVSRGVDNKVHRVACVASPVRFRAVRDFEIMARNRGVNFRAFDNPDEARAWLKEKTLKPPE